MQNRTKKEGLNAKEDYSETRGRPDKRENKGKQTQKNDKVAASDK